MANRKLGRYEVIERLGRGGMAEVYRGYHISLDRYVAIKVLHPFLADDPEFKMRFEKEARNVAKLKHPNIVQVYDFEYDSEGESYYMVMELVEGPTLKDHLFKLGENGERMPLPEALRVIREAASALAYAHSLNMIHRDVKPANLMLDSNKRVVLTDFGIAKIVTGAQFTASGGMVGTPAYMAPEQGLGEAGDERSDLYSLGVILYQTVTGQLPYDAEAPLAVILKHLNAPVPVASELNPALPAIIDQIIMKLMAKDPVDRYQTAEELIADLRKVEAGEAIPAETLQPVSRKSATGEYDTIRLPKGDDSGEIKPVPRNIPVTQSRRAFPWWAVGLVALIVLIGGYYFGARNGVFPALAFLTTETPTPTITPSDTPTQRPSSTEAAAEVETQISDTPAGQTRTPSLSTVTTVAATRRLSDTPAPSDTPSPSYTPSRTPSPTITPTPTVNITLTLIQATLVAEQQTATIRACKYDYEILEQEPLDGEDGGFFASNQPYERVITLENTGNCPWERNTALTFISGEDFTAGPRILIREFVDVGDSVEIQFVGQTPTAGGLPTGTWELRTPGQILIGDPLQISVRVFERPQ